VKSVKLVTPVAIAILLLVTSCAGPAETPGLPKPTPTLPVQGETIIVTSTADSGSGTLRQALLDAESGDTITFDLVVFPPSAPATMYLKANLPPINQSDLTIDASNAGVILDGSNISGKWVHGLEIYSNGNTVRGLQIVNFSGTGIVIGGGAQYNTIGGNRSIGSGPVGQGNLVGNGTVGIGLWDDATSFNTITGNLIGTDPTGIDDWGNYCIGVHILNGASRNIIGPDNIIAYNSMFGIEIRDSGSFGNTITQNNIHDNGIADIFLNEGGNTGLPPPCIWECDLLNGTITGFAGAYDTIEIFSESSREGKVYEGQTKADCNGDFTFSKGASFTGTHLTATATDADGNTSGFSQPTSDMKRVTIFQANFQEGNNLPKTQLQPKKSKELEDNRIGAHTSSLWYPEAKPDIFPKDSFGREVLNPSKIFKLGLKRIRLTVNNVDSWDIYWDKPEIPIDPKHDDFITSLVDNGIIITYIFCFWDKEYVAQGGEVLYPKFKTEDEIQRYLDYVQFIVHHFKDRIQYYEIWNEPDIKDTIQWIEVEDYINLVKRAVPVIREEYPEAKIVVGGTSSFINTESQDYLFSILKSDIMPLVDVVAWHPMYGSSPEYDWHRQYYYNYPSLIQEIKDTASAHGFKGEYVADEIHWRTPDHPEPPWPMYSETKSAKYLTRSIIRHLGMNITVTQILAEEEPNLNLFKTVQNVNTIMAGNSPINLPIEIQSEATNIKSYSFSLSNGDKLIALWSDGVAVDNDPGIEATLTLPGFSAQKVVGIDVLHGFEQQLVTDIEDGNLVIRNLLVRDYPIILRFSP